ncbi:MAG: hypothetical protein AB1472_00230 [Candidatus Omnitrophota bacterium]
MINLKENYKIYIWTIVAALALSIFLPIVKGILEGEKGRVQKFVLQGKRALEKQDILACIGMISDDYKDKYANDKQTLIYLTRETFRYYQELFIQIDKMDIKLEQDKLNASIEIEGIIFGLNKGGQKEFILEKEQGKLMLKLIKQDKRWQLLEIKDFKPITLMGQGII